MTPQKLKNSLLWMAVQGKLSIQGHDETVTFDSDTWEINEEESFTIPENWVWKRFGFFGDLRMGKTILKSDLYDKGIPVYSATQSDDVLGYIKEAELELHKDDLVIPARGNSIGYVTLVRDEIATCTQTTICVRDIHDIYPEYLYWCCYAFKEKWFVFSGSAIPQVTVKQISQFMVPTPPIDEQKRIVAKIEELLPYIDRYEQAWSKLEEFNKRFPVDMQKSILQMAIQGKLVEQRPEEGTGEELYQQIQAEKQALIKAGKIKKEKLLQNISNDEADIDIPESWCLCKLAEVSSKITDGEHKTPKRVSSFCGYYLLSARNIRDGYITLRDVDYVDHNEFTKISKRCNPKKGDILISCSGSVGRCAAVTDDNNYVMVRSAAMVSPVAIDQIYLMYTLQSEYIQEQIRNRTKQTAQANLFQEAIRNLVIPLPPLAEQKRIVAKLEEILPLCERLK